MNTLITDATCWNDGLVCLLCYIKEVTEGTFFPLFLFALQIIVITSVYAGSRSAGGESGNLKLSLASAGIFTFVIALFLMLMNCAGSQVLEVPTFIITIAVMILEVGYALFPSD